MSVTIYKNYKFVILKEEDIKEKQIREKALKQLWKDTFNDSDAYINLIFNSYFAKSIIGITENNEGKIISSLMAIPYLFLVPPMVPETHKILSEIDNIKRETGFFFGWYFCGLSTLPEYRGEGIMRTLMHCTENEIKKRGDLLTFLIPADNRLANYYKRMGYVPGEERAIISTDHINESEGLNERTDTIKNDFINNDFRNSNGALNSDNSVNSDSVQKSGTCQNTVIIKNSSITINCIEKVDDKFKQYKKELNQRELNYLSDYLYRLELGNFFEPINYENNKAQLIHLPSDWETILLENSISGGEIYILAEESFFKEISFFDLGNSYHSELGEISDSESVEISDSELGKSENPNSGGKIRDKLGEILQSEETSSDIHREWQREVVERQKVFSIGLTFRTKDESLEYQDRNSENRDFTNSNLRSVSKMEIRKIIGNDCGILQLLKYLGGNFLLSLYCPLGIRSRLLTLINQTDLNIVSTINKEYILLKDLNTSDDIKKKENSIIFNPNEEINANGENLTGRVEPYQKNENLIKTHNLSSILKFSILRKIENVEEIEDRSKSRKNRKYDKNKVEERTPKIGRIRADLLLD